jgi:elongation factor P--(R)-beta-lysine ligase
VLAPSDLAARRSTRRSRLLVGGRVSDVARGSVLLSDAFASVRMAVRDAESVQPGDLIVVEAEVRGRKMLSSRLLERQPAPAPAAAGEFARLAWQGVGARLKHRARALELVRAYFAAERFVEVDTPVRVTAPGLDLHVDALPAEGGFLITSPEHHMKRLLVGGMPRTFQLVHASRADERGPLHEPEFMMLEWYRAFADSEAVMRDTEAVVSGVVRGLSGDGRARLPSGARVNVTPPYQRLSVRDAFRRHAGIADAVDLAASDEDRYFEIYVNQVEPALARRRRPVFLCDYPLSQASLARPTPADPSVAERFELYVGGIELCNGFGELTDPGEQRRRFERDLEQRKRRRRPLYPIDEKLVAGLEEGMPRSAGNALGIDRLVMLATGARTIADVQAFPGERL